MQLYQLLLNQLKTISLYYFLYAFLNYILIIFIFLIYFTNKYHNKIVILTYYNKKIIYLFINYLIILLNSFNL